MKCSLSTDRCHSDEACLCVLLFDYRGQRPDLIVVRVRVEIEGKDSFRIVFPSMFLSMRWSLVRFLHNYVLLRRILYRIVSFVPA